ncbi:VOC family protein [Paenibacillus harenae]|uniref:VOC family protein n=1 Tax=Paenibacillus harenae TaxID=306543 RepID=UPI0004274AA8|nr:VOC family protein [Paenibacillus harenae]
MKIIDLELRTHKLEEMKRFYTGKIGFPLEHQTEDSFTVRVGVTKLTFVREGSDTIPYYHFAMNIPENQITEAKEWLTRQGCTIMNAEPMEYMHIQADANIAYFKGTDAHALYFEDPSGNLLEFIARHRMQNTSAKPFDVSSILNISEIGFPLRNTVPEAIEILGSQTDVTPYIGDGKSFQMMGDDHGMFILGDLEIGWYPTRKIPEIHPIRMSVLHDRNEAFRLHGYPYDIRTIAPTSITLGERIQS